MDNSHFKEIKVMLDYTFEETKGKTILSIFNEQVICLECKETEKKHPKYDSAVQAEYEQVKKGNYNFEGIGLPDDYDNFMKSIKQKI